MRVFELCIEIEPIKGNRWRVRVNPIGAHARHGDVAPVKPNLDGYDNWDDVVAAMTPGADYTMSGTELRALGRGIWTGLFAAPTLAKFMYEHLMKARTEKRSLRYVLKLDEANDTDLAILPIELAYSGDPDAGERFEWRQADAPAIRVVSELEAPSLRLEPGARLVIATAHDPNNPKPSKDELAAHASEIAEIARSAGLEANIVPEATTEALRLALRLGADALYLVAHGHPDPDRFGFLTLVGETLSGTRLKQMLHDTHNSNRRCRAVILCACSSATNRPGLQLETTGMAQELSKHAVEASLGFRSTVSVVWAFTFMKSLFDALSKCGDLELAFSRARASLKEEDPQWPLAAYYGRPLKSAEASAESVISPSLPRLANILGDKPRAYFTAREVEVERLLKLVDRPGVTVIHAVEGEGGVGKSELARVIAHRLREKRTVLWLDRPDQNPRAAWTKMLSVIPGDHSEAVRELPDDAFTNYVRIRLTEYSGLLVLDDVSNGAVIQEMILSPGWNTLVTTRVNELLPDSGRVELGNLNQDEARLLFCRVAFGSDQSLPEVSLETEAVVARMGGLPLALELAGRSIWLGTPISEYLRLLDAEHGLASVDTARVQATLARSLNEIGVIEQRTFEILGIFPACGADSATVAHALGVSEGEASRSLAVLAKYRIARQVPEFGIFTMHPLLRREALVRGRAWITAWREMRLGVARAMLRQAIFAFEPFYSEPNLAVNRWHKIAERIETLDLSPWFDNSPGAKDLIVLFAYFAAAFRDKLLVASARRDAHLAAIRLVRECRAHGENSKEVALAYSALLNHLGDAHLDIGDVSLALDAYTESLDVAQGQITADSEDAIGWRDVSVSYNKVGDARLRMGDGKGALDAYNQALEIARRLAAKPSSTDPNYLRDLAVALYKVGDVLLQGGNFEQALSSYGEGVGIVQDMLRQNPESLQAKRDVSLGLVKLGDLWTREGRYAEAHGAYVHALRLRREVAEVDMHSMDVQRDVSASLNRVGDVLLRMGDKDGAANIYSDGTEIARDLVVRDRSAKAQRDLFVSLVKLGDVSLSKEEYQKALDAFSEGLKIARDLMDRDLRNAMAKLDVSTVLTRMGDVRGHVGDRDGAKTAIVESLKIARELVSQEPDNVELVHHLCITLFAASIDEKRAAAPGSARDLLAEAIAQARTLQALAPLDSTKRRVLELLLKESGEQNTVGQAAEPKNLQETRLSLSDDVFRTGGPNRTYVSRAARTFSWFVKLAPRRVREEKIGDALEVIASMEKAGYSGFRIRLKVWVTIFVIVLSGLREIVVAALTGRRTPDR